MSSLIKSFSASLRTVLLTCTLILSAEAVAQQNMPAGFSVFVVPVSRQDSVVQLPSQVLLQGSESVLVDSSLALQRSVDYSIDYRTGRLLLHRQTHLRLLADSLQHHLVIVYRALPFVLKSEYALRKKIVLSDSAHRTVPPSTVQMTLFDDLVGSSLQNSGSLTRGFNIGSNRDISLTSGFRMQLSGNLAHDVGIVAALTDERTPIQPEGTTQTLREVDKVFVEVRAPSYSATVGDFNFEVNEQDGGEFARVSRKVQGGSGSLTLGRDASILSQMRLTATGATQRGKYHTNQYQGREGNQGPYQLTGRNGERRIIIVAGSERVYVNGELLVRGETNDYTIDYSSGELFFTSKRLMTASSRITVDFEYTDRQFTRNLLAGTGTFSLGNDRLKLSALVLQEADDPDAPLDRALDDTARAILQKSGADRFRASLPGATMVGRDSAGSARGQYVLKDTVIGGKTYAMFVYAPGDPRALYAVSFSPVDRMPLDSLGYIRVGIGQFRVAGVGQGNYLPVQFLAIPQLLRVLDVNAFAALGSNLSLTGEYALSHFDRNRLSSLDDADRQGSAVKFGLQFHPKNVTLAGISVGDIDVTLSERLVDRRFTALDRYNEVEFDRKWGVESLSGSSEEIREANLSLKPSNRWTLAAGYGVRDFQDLFRSTRFQTDILFQDSARTSLRYRREEIRSTAMQQNEESIWSRQRGSVEYSVWHLQPALRVETEERTRSSSRADSLREGSFRFTEIAPRLTTLDLTGFRAVAEFYIRSEDSVAVGILAPAFRSFTQTYAAEVQPSAVLSIQLSLNRRTTKFTDLFRQRGNTDADVTLVRAQSRYSPFERAVDATLLYEFANHRAARAERVFLRVPRGTGNYRYQGDLNKNGLADENEFELTRFDGDYIVVYAAGEQLVPVSDLKMNVRLRFEPARLFRQPSTTLGKLLNVVSTETFFRVEERSTEPDTRQIYSLHFSRFLNDATTISGSRNITQDIYVNEFSADFSVRFRLLERKSVVQLVSATEKSYALERSVRLRTQLLPEIGNQTEFNQNIDRVTASARTPRERDLNSMTLSNDVAYRPDPAWEIGFRIEVSRVEDRFRSPAPIVDINEQVLRVSYALLDRGQARAELRREEAVLSQGVVDPTTPFPFEFTNGKVIGKSILWQLAFDYRISQHMQVTFLYHGRKEGAKSIVHLGQAEAKLFF